MELTTSTYVSLYGEDGEITECIFERLAFEAEIYMDRQTTGIDNVHKLRQFFPTDEIDAKIVRRCAYELIHLLYRLEMAEKIAEEANGYVERPDGTKMPRRVASVSSGSESVSYVAPAQAPTVIEIAVSDKNAKQSLINDIIRRYLGGVSDSNGVNLLYMGGYPRVC